MEKLPQDPIMLLSTVNMLLRDRYGSLAELCEDLGADAAEIEATLSAAGFEYQPVINQFR